MVRSSLVQNMLVVLVDSSLLLVVAVLAGHILLVEVVAVRVPVVVPRAAVLVLLASWKLASLVEVVRLAFLVLVVLEAIRLVLF